MNQGSLGITLRPVADKLDHYFPAVEQPRASIPPPPTPTKKKKRNAGKATEIKLLLVSSQFKSNIISTNLNIK